MIWRWRPSQKTTEGVVPGTRGATGGTRGAGTRGTRTEDIAGTRRMGPGPGIRGMLTPGTQTAGDGHPRQSRGQNQTKPNQTKPNQTKPNQTKP